jgi:glutaminyl-peptide cyclotransferase
MSSLLGKVAPEGARRGVIAGVAFCAAWAPGAGAGLPAATPVYGYKVVATRPHDRHAYTEGLAYRDGYLIESTGQRSTLRRVAVRTGKVLKEIRLPGRYFAEGAAVLGRLVYQLTWMNHQGFVYDLKTFRRIRSFRYSGEGWGLARAGSALVMSNGTAVLTFRAPGSFAIRRRITVTDAGRPVAGLNELEMVGRVLCANVDPTDRIACIDPASGEVRYWLDLTGLLPEPLRADESADLNGIAYDARRKRLFVTGKLWPRLYQIRRAQQE